MEIWEYLDIKLDKEVYYPGQTMHGEIFVTNSESAKINAIQVLLKGVGHTEWKIQRGNDWNVFKDDQTFLTNRLTLIGKEQIVEVLENDKSMNEFDNHQPVSSISHSTNTIILPAGQHKWKFQFYLPESCLPCSFESRTGHIRFYLCLYVNIPFASCPSCVKYFSMISPRIDCMDSKYLTPQHLVANYKPRYWICSYFSKQIKMIAQLERSAYCSGEYIKLRCRVINGEDGPQRLWIRLLQKAVFHVSRGMMGVSREHQHTALEFIGEKINPKSDSSYDLYRYLRVPPLPPTLKVNYCKLLEVTYNLRISLVEHTVIYNHDKYSLCAYPQSFHRNQQLITIEIPITIATLPFHIPNGAPSFIEYRKASDQVEGGNYISPEFRQGQVYDGECGFENDNSVIYQPTYVFVSTKNVNSPYAYDDCYADEKCTEKISTV